MTAHPAVPHQPCRAADGIRRVLSGAAALKRRRLAQPNHLSWRRPGATNRRAVCGPTGDGGGYLGKHLANRDPKTLSAPLMLGTAPRRQRKPGPPRPGQDLQHSLVA